VARRIRSFIIAMDFTEFCTRYKTLLGTMPQRPNMIVKSENSPFGDYLYNCSNVYLGFDVAETRDSFYIYDSFQTKSSIDCSYAVDSELCHESVDIYKCYNSSNLIHCIGCVDCAYCVDCVNCHDCFGSAYLKNKRFCLFNKQLEENEYYEQVRAYKDKDPKDILQMLHDLRETFPKPINRSVNNENSQYGNYFYNNNSCYYLYDAAFNQNSAFLFDSHQNKNCFDQTYAVNNELCYELTDSVDCYECFYGSDLAQCVSCQFSLGLIGCNDCFGCAFLNKKQYCILNKQYVADEYAHVVGEIRKSMKVDYVQQFKAALAKR